MSCSLDLTAKVRILTFHYNLPEFILLQHKSLQKFLKDDYELIVFNDAATTENEINIRNVCESLGIQCVRFKPEWHISDPLNQQIKEWLMNPAVYSHLAPINTYPERDSIDMIANLASCRHCHIIQYAMDNYGYNHDDIVVIMDGDAFIIRDINLKRMLKKCDILGAHTEVSEENVSYLWVPFIAFYPQKLPNLRDLRFNIAVINNKLHDTGSQTYHYLKNNPKVRAKTFQKKHSSGYNHWAPFQIQHAGFSDQETRLIKALHPSQCVQFLIEDKVLHFMGSSTLFEEQLSKVELVSDFINTITKE